MTVIRRLQAHFHTLSDDKDRDNGISEKFMFGSQILGANTSWGKGLVFRENAHDIGQEFDVSKFAIDLQLDFAQLRYEYDMDNTDGWSVRISIQAILNDGTAHVIAEENRDIGNHGGFHHPKFGSIPFRRP